MIDFRLLVNNMLFDINNNLLQALFSPIIKTNKGDKVAGHVSLDFASYASINPKINGFDYF